MRFTPLGDANALQLPLTELTPCKMISSVQVRFLVTVVDTEINDIDTAPTVSHALANYAIPYDHSQVEDDEKYQDRQHDIAENLVSQIVDPWESTLEDEE